MYQEINVNTGSTEENTLTFKFYLLIKSVSIFFLGTQIFSYKRNVPWGVTNLKYSVESFGYHQNFVADAKLEIPFLNKKNINCTVIVL